MSSLKVYDSAQVSLQVKGIILDGETYTAKQIVNVVRDVGNDSPFKKQMREVGLIQGTRPALETFLFSLDVDLYKDPWFSLADHLLFEIEDGNIEGIYEEEEE